jgi:hypothetical protein
VARRPQESGGEKPLTNKEQMNRHFPAPINEKQWANPEVLIERAEVEKEEAERQHQRNKKKHGKQGVDLEYINE